MTSIAGPPGRRNIRALTGVRFFAAVWVVFFHFRGHLESVFPLLRHLEPITGAGSYGVDLFFILSGFVIAYNYAPRFAEGLKRREYSRFLWLRLARMYPVHLATLAFLAVVVVAARAAGRPLNNPYGLPSLIRNVFLVNAWGGHEDMGWNYPAWSISAEWFAYLLFPFAARAFTRVRSLRASVTAVVCALGIFLAARALLHTHAPLLQVTGEFAAGMFLAHLYRVTRPSAAWDWASGLSIVAVFVVLLTTSGQLESSLVVVLFAILIMSLAHGRAIVAPALSVGWIVFLGEVSYALYMTHALVEMVVGKALPMEAYADASLIVRASIVAAYATIIAVVAIGTHLLLERPARARMGRLYGRSDSASTPDVTAPRVRASI